MVPITLTLFTLLFSTPTLALWPAPRSLVAGNTTLRLSSSFSISASFRAPADLQDAISRTASFLRSDDLAPLVVDRGASLLSAARRARQVPRLTLSLAKGARANSIATEAVKTLEARDESYTLTVPSDGSGATLVANSSLGLFRGLTTFGQLWFTVDGTTFLQNAPVSIVDAPAFPFRGFMLDTARNFFPVSDIKRTLDAMSWVKINQFLWHIVDSQSFPLQVPGFTEIAQRGAYDDASVYTPSDVKDIVSFAAARGIDILVEIDTPGHTSVISKSHPEHIACPESTPWSSFANEPPAGQLRLASPATTNFTANLLAAVARMFPSTLFSTGGDEINANCYDKDAETQAGLSGSGKTFEEALDTFTNVTHEAVRAQGKVPVVWEEMVLAHNVTLPKDVIAMVWISSADVAAVVQKGYRVVHAASDFFYLDCGGGGWVGENINGNSWCDPFKTWQKSYSFDPFANITSDQQSLILGGEHLLWTEQSSPANLDPIVWPRAASSAEVFWTGATFSEGGETRERDVGEALPRLHEMAFRLRSRGVNAISLQPLWCALRPGVCDLSA